MRKMAQLLADLVMRQSSNFNMEPWFLEELSGPERALVSIQTWDFMEISAPPVGP